jgi:hypothetical protein
VDKPLRKPDFPFPFEYFKQHEDNRVVLCEGEKDALNLVSLGVNCLTLGGVANSWSRHKGLLRGKDIYVWFDHDKAGYGNGIRRLDELQDIAKTIQLVLFSRMSGNLPEHYDISDFLEDRKVNDKEALFQVISKACQTDIDQPQASVDRSHGIEDTQAQELPGQEAVAQHNPSGEGLKRGANWKQTTALLFATAALLGVALSVHTRLPYQFYTLSRVVNFSVFSLVAFFSFREKDINFVIIFGILAFLFNPVKPFWLTRGLCIIIDVIVLIIAGYYVMVRNKLFGRMLGR